MTSKMITNIIDPLLSGYLSGMVPTECAHIKVSPLYKAVWKITSRLRIVMISSGICRINMNKNEYVLYRNDMLIMFSGYEYKIQSEGEDSTELWWIDITGLGVDGFLSMLSLSEQNCYIQGISNPSCLRELMNIVLYCGDMTRSDILNSIGGMYKMLAVLVDECTHPEWTIVPHDSQSIIYTGNWTAWPSKISTEHNEYYTNMKCAYAELNFYGTGIKWYGTMNFDCGKADVIIDGIYQTTVDAYYPVRLAKQLLYTNTHLPSGHHIIKIFCTGEKNDKAKNCDVVVESFQYLIKMEEPQNSGQEYKSGIVKRAKQFIEVNYTQDLSIDRLASLLNVSRPYLTSKFTNEVGISPIQYLSKLRVSRAKSLLLSADISISEIASAVGFKDAFYFSRFFRKYCNMSPSQYREARKNGYTYSTDPHLNGSVIDRNLGY